MSTYRANMRANLDPKVNLFFAISIHFIYVNPLPFRQLLNILIIESFIIKRIGIFYGYRDGTVTSTSRPPASEESMTPCMMTFVNIIS